MNGGNAALSYQVPVSVDAKGSFGHFQSVISVDTLVAVFDYLIGKV